MKTITIYAIMIVGGIWEILARWVARSGLQHCFLVIRLGVLSFSVYYWFSALVFLWRVG